MPLVDASESLRTSSEQRPTSPGGQTCATHSHTSEIQCVRDEQPHDMPYIQRNSPVLRLPNEILGYIFRILFDVYYWEFQLWVTQCRHQIASVRHRDFYLRLGLGLLAGPDAGEEPKPPWTIILQVCHAWRLVAFDYAGLWTQINTTNSGWMSHFSHASAQLPLDFELKIDCSPEGLHAVKLAGERSIERARKLSIYAPANIQIPSINDFLDRLLGYGAPQLRTLKVDLREPREGGTGRHELRLLGDELFLGRLSHLEDVSIDCPSAIFSMQMSHPAFRGLRCLIINSKHAWQQSTTDQFLSCLQTWSQLCLLSLESGLPTDVVGIPAIKSSTPVALPSIGRITFTDEAHLISSFMAHVSLDPSTDVSFKFMIANKHLSMGENDFRRAAAVRLISRLFSEFAGAPLVDLNVWCEGSWDAESPDLRFISVSASTVPLLQDEDSDEEDIGSLHMIFNMIDDPPVRASCLQTIFDAMQLSYVKKLELAAPDAYFLIDWLQILPRLQDLRKLIIRADLFGPLIMALGIAATERYDGQTGIVERKMFLPRLNRLKIEQYRTDRGTFDLLSQALKNRMDWGSPLPELCLFMHTWQLDADLEGSLQESVGDLGIFIYSNRKGPKKSSEESSEDGDNEREDEESQNNVVRSQTDGNGGIDVEEGDGESGSQPEDEN